jgi:hypothetical protein
MDQVGEGDSFCLKYSGNFVTIVWHFSDKILLHIYNTSVKLPQNNDTEVGIFVFAGPFGNLCRGLPFRFSPDIAIKKWVATRVKHICNSSGL